MAKERGIYASSCSTSITVNIRRCVRKEERGARRGRGGTMMAYLSRVKRIMKAEAGEVKEREIKIGLIVYYKEKRKRKKEKNLLKG